MFESGAIDLLRVLELLNELTEVSNLGPRSLASLDWLVAEVLCLRFFIMRSK